MSPFLCPPGSSSKLAEGELGQIGNGRAVVGDDTLDDVVKEDNVVLPDAFTLGRGEGFFEIEAVAPVAPSGLNFIVAAPERDARMIAKTLYLLSGFLANVFLEREIAGNHGAAEHEVLPDENAELITDVVKVVGFVVAAAPVADHVHVGVLGGLEDLTMLGGSNAGRKLSKGMTSAPLPKTEMPLMTKVKLFPHSSFTRRSSMERRPVRSSAWSCRSAFLVVPVESVP